MSIIIRGMKMPKSCNDCPCQYDYLYCKATDKQFEYREEPYVDMFDTRMPWCPLVELPPHGRLIIDEKGEVTIEDS